MVGKNRRSKANLGSVRPKLFAFIFVLVGAIVLLPSIASASHSWNVAAGIPYHWQKYGPEPSGALILDKTNGSWPSYVASAASTWNNGTTTVDFFRYVGSDCGLLPDGYATVCNADYTDSCGGYVDWVGCTDPLGVNSQTGHWVKAQVRFDDNVPGFTWTDAKRQEVACHELGHVLGLLHDQPTGCLESVATGNYTTPAAHDYEQANANHNHTDCVPPCPQRAEEDIIRGKAIPITVRELLLQDLGTPPFLLHLLVP